MEIQTTIREFPQKIKSLNISPETSIRVIISDLKNKKKQGEKGKWAKVAEKMANENLLDGEAGETLRKTSREFRDNFCFREPQHFERVKND